MEFLICVGVIAVFFSLIYAKKQKAHKQFLKEIEQEYAELEEEENLMTKEMFEADDELTRLRARRDFFAKPDFYPLAFSTLTLVRIMKEQLDKEIENKEAKSS